MTHIAIQEKLDSKVVDWMEKVTNEQYPEVTAGGAATEGYRSGTVAGIAVSAKEP